jgi:hypothetical protein
MRYQLHHNIQSLSRHDKEIPNRVGPKKWVTTQDWGNPTQSPPRGTYRLRPRTTWRPNLIHPRLLWRTIKESTMVVE